MEALTGSTFSLDKLSDEILSVIIDYLPLLDKIKIERVSKRWRNLGLQSSSREKLLNLKHIFKNRNKIKHFEVDKILQRSGEKLIYINLSHVTQPKPKDLFQLINKYCRNLKYLDVSTLKLTDQDLSVLSTDIIKNLEVVLMEVCDLKDTSLYSFLDKAVKLVALSVVGNYNEEFQGTSLSHLSLRVETLNVSFIRTLDPNVVHQALARLSNLERLDISFTHFSANVLYGIAPRLKTLGISCTSNFFNDDHYANLSFPKLESLDASQQCLPEEFFKFICNKCPELKTLNLRAVHFAKPDPDKFKALKNHKKLERLILNGTEIEVKTINFWLSKGRMFHLKQLEVDCPNITEKGLTKIIKLLPKLEGMYFGHKGEIDLKTFLETTLEAVETRSNIPLELHFFHTENLKGRVEELRKKNSANKVKIEHFVGIEAKSAKGDNMLEQKVKFTPVVKNPVKI